MVRRRYWCLVGLSISFDKATICVSSHKIRRSNRPYWYLSVYQSTCADTTYHLHIALESFYYWITCRAHSQTRVHSSARGSFRPRGGGPGHAAPPANWSGQGPPPGMSSSNWHYLQNPDKEPPPGYICFRCGQKGGSRSCLSILHLSDSLTVMLLFPVSVQVTGSKLVRQTRTRNSKANPVSSGRRVFRNPSSRPWRSLPTGRIPTIPTWEEPRS